VSSDQPQSAVEWVSIQVASQRLGISPVSVRRWIRRGKLEAELQPGRKGTEYRVKLPAEYAGDQPPASQVSTQVISEMLAVITRQQADLVARSESNAAWAARAELLEQQVAELRAELERARRPWWRRVLG
jgi:predicted site-specific integrase-resolvase